MISVNDLKTGITIKVDNNIFKVIEFQHVKPGKGSAFVRSKLKNLKTGSIIDHTFNAGIKVAKANVETKTLQFSYSSGDEYTFMNMETYDMVSIPLSKLKKEHKYLKEGLDVKIMQHEGEILEVIIPEKIAMKVVNTSPAVKGDTATNALKEAEMDTGVIIKVPLFIENDDELIVNTTNGTYVSRK